MEWDTKPSRAGVQVGSRAGHSSCLQLARVGLAQGCGASLGSSCWVAEPPVLCRECAVRAGRDFWLMLGGSEESLEEQDVPLGQSVLG